MYDSFSGSARPETAKEKATSLFLDHHRFVEMLAFKVAPVGNIQRDVVHDCFVAFVEKADQWNLDADVRPILFRITRNVALKYWKKYLQSLPEQLRETYEYAYSTRLESTEFSLCDKLETEEEILALRLCIQKLTPDCRMLVERHYYHGMTYAEISETTGRTTSVLTKAMCRIRTMLAQCIATIIGTEVQG